MSKREIWRIREDAKNIIDLSYPMIPGMTLLKPIYADIEFKIDRGHFPEVDETGYPPKGFYARCVSTGPDGLLEGYGTHVEASSHAFGTRGMNIDEYPLTAFIGAGVVIEIASKAEEDPEYKATVDDLKTWEKRHGEIPPGSILILNTGRGRQWRDYDAFFGVDGVGHYHYPGIAPEACKWLVEHRRISAIGTDAATIDGWPAVPVPGYPKDRMPHGLSREIVMSPPHHILNIEYLANVDKLPEAGALIICAPINFVGGYAGMVRCLAVLPENQKMS